MTTVRCACGAEVAPTIPGGRRPKVHNDPLTEEVCRKRQVTSAVCKRCGGQPHSPRHGCTSQVFHPSTWTVDGREVGNPAAAGEVCGVSGEQFLKLTRMPPGPRRAPEYAGYDHSRGGRYWDLEQVREFQAQRPGKVRREEPAATGA